MQNSLLPATSVDFLEQEWRDWWVESGMPESGLSWKSIRWFLQEAITYVTRILNRRRPSLRVRLNVRFATLHNMLIYHIDMANKALWKSA